MSRHIPSAPVRPEGVKFVRGLVFLTPLAVLFWASVIVAVHVAVSGRI